MVWYLKGGPALLFFPSNQGQLGVKKRGNGEMLGEFTWAAVNPLNWISSITFWLHGNEIKSIWNFLLFPLTLGRMASRKSFKGQEHLSPLPPPHKKLLTLFLTQGHLQEGSKKRQGNGHNGVIEAMAQGFDHAIISTILSIGFHPRTHGCSSTTTCPHCHVFPFAAGSGIEGGVYLWPVWRLVGIILSIYQLSDKNCRCSMTWDF